MNPKVTTKTGDDGMTSFVNNIRISKDSPIVECLGNIDELNACLGMHNGNIFDTEQYFLIKLSGYILLGCEDIDVVKNKTIDLEKTMNELKKEIEIPNKFIIPKGYIHLARTVCRRAERSLVKLDNYYYDRKDIKTYIQYLNRLSDYLFIYAIYVN